MSEATNRSETGRFKGIVRPLVEEDLPQIRPILETWLKDRGTGELEKAEVEEDLGLMRDSCKVGNERAYFVAEEPDGQVIGVIGMTSPSEVMHQFTVTRNPVELVNAYVAKEHRSGRGVGSALVARLEDEARRREYTEVAFNSGPRYKDTAWGFYDNLPGYSRVGVAEKLYGEGGDAPVWSKIL